MSLPPFTFLPLYFFTQILEPSVLRGLSFDLEEQSLKDKDKSTRWNSHAHPDSDNGLHLDTSRNVCFKWSRGPGRNHLTSKALGHHFLSTLSTNTWKSYLHNSPVTKVLTREVRAQGPNPHLTEETVLPTRLLKRLKWGCTSSWKCSSVQSDTQYMAREQSIWTKWICRLLSMAHTWVGQEKVKHECKFKQLTKITKIWFLQVRAKSWCRLYYRGYTKPA